MNDLRAEGDDRGALDGSDRAARMNELALQGLCCSQVMVRTALEEDGAENEQLVQAAGALCFGMFAGGPCGALTAGKIVMALRASRPLDDALATEFVEWFRNEYGSLECSGILKGDPFARVLVCPNLVVRTYDAAMRILADRGALIL